MQPRTGVADTEIDSATVKLLVAQQLAISETGE